MPGTVVRFAVRVIVSEVAEFETELNATPVGIPDAANVRAPVKLVRVIRMARFTPAPPATVEIDVLLALSAMEPAVAAVTIRLTEAVALAMPVPDACNTMG